MITKTHKKRSRLKVLAAAVVLLAIVGGSYALIRHNQHQPKTPATPAGVKLAPATAQEKQQSADNKNQIVQEQQQAAQTPSSTKKSVSVVITNASSSSVNAYVTGVFEDGGTCTATFSQTGGAPVTRTSTGFSNVSYTQCAPITPNLPSVGAWSVVVSYNSTDASGVSQPQAF